MARKANIAKAEIIEACWKLIEENTFPNIPRLSAYFQNLDGRGCSNTTLLNAITEWEEAYREQQESELADIKGSLEPSFKRFERDVIQALSVVVDEKIQAFEEQLSLRKSALEGRQNSLSEALIQSEQALEASQTQLNHLTEKHERVVQKNTLTHERYEATLARVRVLESELAQSNRSKQEAQTKLNQAQVDLAKQDKQIEMLSNALTAAQEQVTQLQNSQQASYSSQFAQAIKDLQEISKSIPQKKADS